MQQTRHLVWHKYVGATEYDINLENDVHLPLFMVCIRTCLGSKELDVQETPQRSLPFIFMVISIGYT